MSRGTPRRPRVHLAAGDDAGGGVAAPGSEYAAAMTADLGELARAAGVEPFDGDGVHGLVVSRLRPEPLGEHLGRLADPAAAEETLHWGRNYLYSLRLPTAGGEIEVVVKQFRNQGLRGRFERRLRGSKAVRAWRGATALAEAGITTAEPVMLIESDRPDGPSLYVCRRVRSGVELRHFFRRLAGDRGAQPFPEVSPDELLSRLGRLARRVHEAGVVYRDLSIGNVLAVPDDDGRLELVLVDTNRSRVGAVPGTYRRVRDLCRFPILDDRHRESFLRGYWEEVPPRWSPRWWLYVASVRGYLLKHAVKNGLRARPRRHRRGAGHHAHLPAAAEGAGARDKIVWDRLSDQPHQHASGVEKAAIRLADAPSHLVDLAVVARRAPAVWRRFRELRSGLYRGPRPFEGIGIGVRPFPQAPERHLAAIEELGVRHVMVRLHPWEHDRDQEEALARALAGRGLEVSFAVPQVRALVRDRDRWRRAMEELGERFVPYGRAFQIGQAPNRSKWGVWTRSEYLELFRDAAEVLRRHPGVELLGPAVIDFELQATLAIVGRRTAGVRFDALSSLLYVDRRGAPENRQLGFDTVDKVTLVRAIADASPSCEPRSWITEVNWPLWEGPHSPAGRTVSVDEERHADFLVRYFLLTLGTGLVERVFWWRLAARGYGLMVPSADGELAPRPAFAALRTLVDRLDGATFSGPLPAAAGVHLYRFESRHGPTVVGWCPDGTRRAELPSPPAETVDRDGRPLPAGGGASVEVGPSPRYFAL